MRTSSVGRVYVSNEEYRRGISRLVVGRVVGWNMRMEESPEVPGRAGGLF